MRNFFDCVCLTSKVRKSFSDDKAMNFFTKIARNFLPEPRTGTRLRPDLHSAVLSGRKRKNYAYYRLWLRSRLAARCY